MKTFELAIARGGPTAAQAINYRESGGGGQIARDGGGELTTPARLAVTLERSLLGGSSR
jgi:hypothetical protein